MTAAAGRALVLTAGRGTRLRPLTYDRAKAAVPVAGVPLICRILGWLADQDLRDVVLNLHHLPPTITRVVGDGAGRGLRVRYSWEPELLGSAGGPRRALPLLDSRFFIANGDTMTDVRLAELEHHHRRSGALVTLAVVPTLHPPRYGGVVADEDGWVTGFLRPGHPQPSWHFVGIQIVERDVFRTLPDGVPAATIPDLYGKLVVENPRSIAVHPVSATFHDVGTPDDYLRTSLAFAEREGFRELPAGRGVSFGKGAEAHRTIIWDDVVIGASARLVDCIIGDGVRIPPGATFERHVVVRAIGRSADLGEGRLDELLVAPLEARGHGDDR